MLGGKGFPVNERRRQDVATAKTAPPLVMLGRPKREVKSDMG